MKYTITSFYTKNTPYEAVAKEYLQASLDTLGITNYRILPLPSQHSWNKNTSLKPLFLLKQLAENPEDIVWLDADAKVVQPLSLFDNFPQEYHIGVHYLDWSKQYERPGDTTRELVSSVLYLRNCPEVYALVATWATQTKNNESTWEQKILQRILTEDTSYKVYNLPEEYCCIMKHNKTFPAYIANPVIQQYQASRSFKKMVR